VQLLYTLFDEHDPPKPLISGVVIDKTVKFYPMYMKGTGLSLYQVEENKQKVIEALTTKVFVNDMKTHIWALDLPTFCTYDAYTFPSLRVQPDDLKQAKKYIASKLISMKKTKPSRWQKILADACLVYQHLQNRGVIVDWKLEKPLYGFTITGRSSTSGFNIQGATEESDVRIAEGSEDYLVHFDWMGADLRAASVLSKDEKMQAVFEKSDPYTVLAEDLQKHCGYEANREDLKVEFLKSMYSLNVESPVFEYYPGFLNWMKEALVEMRDTGYTETILGRRFSVESGEKTAFNAIIQGTVAHAMQLVLIKLFAMMPDQILTEVHDSVIISCDKSSVSNVLKEVLPVMLRPFDGVLSSNPVFPVKVSIGKRWRKWKRYKEFRK